MLGMLKHTTCEAWYTKYILLLDPFMNFALAHLIPLHCFDAIFKS